MVALFVPPFAITVLLLTGMADKAVVCGGDIGAASITPPFRGFVIGGAGDIEEAVLEEGGASIDTGGEAVEVAA